MKILKKFFIFVLVFMLLFAPNNSSLAINDSLLKIQESQEKLKSGAQHITVTKIKGEPMHYFELFRYTALDDIIPSLKFEKDPWGIINNKYEKKFKIIKNFCTAIGAFAGAGLGWIFWKWVNNHQEGESKKLEPKEKIEQNNFKGNENPSGSLDKIKKSALPTFVVSASAAAFGVLMNLISSLYSSNFMEKEREKLYIEKENALLVMKCLLTHIDRKNWEHGDSILIQINSNPNYPTAVPTMVKSGINYSNEEIKNFPKAFETLKKNLEETLKNNDYKK